MHRKAIYISVLLATALITFLFVDFMHSPISGAAAKPGKVDAIVVLTGGKGRADTGLDLFRGGQAGLLVLSGVHEDADLDSIFFKRIKPDEHKNVVLEKSSKSTYQNAIEVRAIMEQRGLRTMILVTSSYHIKRALYTFKQIMPPSITIHIHRVEGTAPIPITIQEFFKYYWYLLRFRIEALT